MLYLAIHPSPSDEPLWGFIDQANAGIRPLCKSSAVAEYTDYLHLLCTPDRRPKPDLFRPDRLHFTAAFYDRLSAFLRPRVMAAPQPGERVRSVRQLNAEHRILPRRTTLETPPRPSREANHRSGTEMPEAPPNCRDCRKDCPPRRI